MKNKQETYKEYSAFRNKLSNNKSITNKWNEYDDMFAEILNLFEEAVSEYDWRMC